MEVRSAFFCDAANLEVSGKLNVLGIFENIFAPEFPFIHHQCIFVAKIQGQQDDLGTHQLLITFEDANGNQLLPKYESAFELTADYHSHYCIIALTDNNYPSPGVYSAVITVDGKQLRTEDINVENAGSLI